MAAVDKIFGSTNKEKRMKQYDELMHWLAVHNSHALKYLNERDRVEKGASIALFSEEVDLMLIVHCPFVWVRKQIIEQYDILEFMKGEERGFWVKNL